MSDYQRIALGVEYDGSRFYGFQTQRQQPTVQQELERVLSRVANGPVQVQCSGRTDTGVHALCQVIHFDTTAQRSERSWVLGANTHLPPAATVLWAREVPLTFHARHSSLSRTYRYRIINRWTRPALEHERACWVREELDAKAMHEAAQQLIGEHDFNAFRAIGCQSASSHRHVHAITVQRAGMWVELEITANAFLYHMVRNIAGTLIEVGRGARDAAWVAAALASRDRTQAGPTAAATGLYFIAPQYHPDWGLPESGAAFPRGWNLS
ncbi:MAG: tRNA pseudouridine(38-40) synthase TruA [Wenzhouxiangellaceae bacterium]